MNQFELEKQIKEAKERVKLYQDMIKRSNNTGLRIILDVEETNLVRLIELRGYQE